MPNQRVGRLSLVVSWARLSRGESLAHETTSESLAHETTSESLAHETTSESLACETGLRDYLYVGMAPTRNICNTFKANAV